MENDKILQKILEEIQGMNQRFDGMDKRFDGIDQRLDGIDQRLDGMDKRFDIIEERLDNLEDITTKTSIRLENDIAPKVQLLLENHSDLAKNVNVAKDVEDRVSVLEFDVKVIKGTLKAMNNPQINQNNSL
jgi:archaellum component FlaC